ncbi:MAG: DUF262 domain-containing protein [Acidobacteria bacterium]|nr:DUF262 domain-containing protein [Acidobacteriota bacterium]
MLGNHTKSEIWSLSDLVTALGDKPEKKQKIIIPQFQRTLVWSKDQKKELISSIKRGFPIGAILLYKIGDDAEGITRYNLIDGLQRSYTLRQYALEPTQFYDETTLREIKTDFFDAIFNVVSAKGGDVKREGIVSEVIKWLRQKKAFEETAGYSSFNLVTHLKDALGQDWTNDTIEKLVTQAIPFLDTVRKESDLSECEIPVLVFNGQQDDLPTIFERLNSQGTQLSKYQIYAATWQVYPAFSINNSEIVKHIKKRYDSLISEGLEVENYESSDKFYTAKFSFFEYLFGYGKYLGEKFNLLFAGSTKPEQEDSIGFNLVNICLGLPFNKMAELPKHLEKHELDKFEDAVNESIEFVFNSLKGFIGIKLNKRQGVLIAHPELQVVSMVGKAFNCRYDSTLELKPGWENKRKALKENLPFHYLFDIIREYWRGSGDKKAVELATSERYENGISKKQWENALDEWFRLELEKREKARSSIKDGSILFMKYLYTHLLTANEEISDTKFDIEHLVPAGRLKGIADDIGVPMSAFPNLCLMDEELNRKKGDLTYYEFFDREVENQELTDQQARLEISKIEKFTFTSRQDLEFVSNSLSKEQYTDFLRKRFEKLKSSFFELNKIQDTEESVDSGDS